jgi:hypothetical protein
MMKKLFVILSAMMLAVVFAIPAGADVGDNAVDWNFYGSVRMQTFRVDQDKNTSATGYDDRDSRWELNPVSHIGAKVHSGNLGGCFEYGHVYDNEYEKGHGHDTSNVTLRKIYGTWDFGVGELTVGKTYTPIHFVTNQVYDNDYGLRGFGAFYVYNPMIQVEIDGFKLALVRPGIGNAEMPIFSDYDTTFPKVEASYTLAMDTFSIKAFGGWSAFEVVNDKDREYDVTCYLYGVAGVVNVGPVTLKAMIWEGQNVNLYGLSYTQEVDFEPHYNSTDDDIRDTNGYGGLVSVGIKFNDVIGLEAGVGLVSSGKDFIDNIKDGQIIFENDNDDAVAAYLQAPITLAKGVTVVPEIGHYDYVDDAEGNDEGKELYFGAKWQINF